MNTLWPECAESDNYSIERSLAQQGYVRIAGTDEVGRGPLAGPVVASCVVLPADCDFHQYKDSKVLTPGNREKLAVELESNGALIGVGIVSAAEIDRINILRASLLAMKKAVEALSESPDFLLVDGKFPVPLPISQQALIKGESKSASIAAASIIAKVKRDGLMEQYHQQFPEYNFCKHKGYATAEHRRLIQTYGPCEIHRRSFKPIRDSVLEDEQKPALLR